MAETNPDKKYEYLFRLELRGKPIPTSGQEKIKILNRRRNKVQLMMLANFVFVLLFYASYHFGYTSLGPGWLAALAAVFALNLVFQLKQANTIKEAIAHYSTR